MIDENSCYHNTMTWLSFHPCHLPQLRYLRSNCTQSPMTVNEHRLIVVVVVNDAQLLLNISCKFQVQPCMRLLKREKPASKLIASTTHCCDTKGDSVPVTLQTGQINRGLHRLITYTNNVALESSMLKKFWCALKSARTFAPT